VDAAYPFFDLKGMRQDWDAKKAGLSTRAKACRSQEAWAAGGSFSSPRRARLFDYRIPFRGKKGESHTIVLQRATQTRQAVLRSTVEARGWPHTYNMPPGLTQAGESLHYAKLAGGAGYMYIRRVNESVEPGIARALEARPDAKG